MPTDSLYPPLDIPDVGLWDFLFENKSREFPDDKAIFTDPHTGRGYTYKQVKQTATDFGKGLRTLFDWQKSDVVALYTPNCIDTPAVIWGTHFAGGIVSPANPAYTVDELVYQLKDSGAKALVTQLPQLDSALQACKKVGIPEDRVILIGDQKHPENRIKHFTSVRSTSGTSRYRRAKVDPDNDLAFLVYSSGTTGLPKGVMLSHRNVVANTMQGAAAEAPLSWKPTSERPNGDILLAFLPFFHIYGLTCLMHAAMYRGLQLVVMPKFDLEGWCKIVQDHKVTKAYVVPPVLLGLSKHPVVDKYNLSSLRMINSGAAPLSRDLIDACYKRVKIPIKQGYGLSETSPTTHLQPWETWLSTAGSVGGLVPNMTAKYMSPEEKELPRGEVGELWVKGPNVFKGYLNNPEGTKHALTDDGYFKTGDVGYQDKDGNFYITDRVKELIKWKGSQVPPAELEGYLMTHDKIANVAVIGVYQKEEETEVPLAYVVPKAGITPSPALGQEIVDWLSKRVAGHKRLRGGVRFTDEIPISASGKILRRMLKQKYEAEEKAKTSKAKL